jgi:hypothetical protein
MRIPARWLAALAVGWMGAALLYLATGHLSLVLLLGPIAFVLGDVTAERRKARLQAEVERAFRQLVSEEEPGFRGDSARVLRQRSRLLGIPPRLVDIRIVRTPEGSHWAVRAEARSADADEIRWRVTRLTDAEVRAALR